MSSHVRPCFRPPSIAKLRRASGPPCCEVADGSRRFQYHRIQPQPAEIESIRREVKADFNDPTTLAAAFAFAGVERLLTISIDGLGDIILSNNSVFG
jgi:hypothetical protein